MINNKANLRYSVIVSAVFSSFKDLIIWRLFFGGGIVLYIGFIFFMSIITEDQDYIIAAIIGILLFVPLWLIFVFKILQILRKKKENVMLACDKYSLHIDDGRLFTINFSDIKYIDFFYDVPLTTNKEGLISESQINRRTIETIKEESVYKISKIRIQASKSYYELKDFIRVGSLNPEEERKKNEYYPSTNKCIKEFFCYVRKHIEFYLKDDIEIDKVVVSRSGVSKGAIFSGLIPYRGGKRTFLDSIALNDISIFMLVFLPFIELVVVLIYPIFL